MCFKNSKNYKITEKLIGQPPVLVDFPVTKKHIRFILVFKKDSDIYFWIDGDEHVSIKWSYWGEKEWNNVSIGGISSPVGKGQEEYSFYELILTDDKGFLLSSKVDRVVLIDIQREKEGPGKFSVRAFDELKIMIET